MFEQSPCGVPLAEGDGVGDRCASGDGLDQRVADVLDDELVAERLQDRGLARAWRPGQHKGEHAYSSA